MKIGTNFDHDITFIFVTISDFCNEYEIHLAQHLIGNTPLSSTDGNVSVEHWMAVRLLNCIMGHCKLEWPINLPSMVSGTD